MGTPNQPISSGIAPPTVPGSPTAPATSVTFGLQNVQPPSVLYIARDDQLIISTASSQTSEVVTVNARILDATGRIHDNQFIVRPASNRAVQAQSFTLVEGYLLSLSCLASVAVTRGQTFVRCFINRGASGAGQPGQMLFADYVTTQLSSGYPNGRILAPTEGPGFVTTFAVAQPAAGAEWVQAVPTNARWRIRSGAWALQTSVAAGNRNPGVQLAAVTGSPFQAFPLSAVPASTLAGLIAVGITPYVGLPASTIMLPLPPDLVLAATAGVVHAIGSFTVGLLAGDQYSGIKLLVEEWLDNV